MKSVTEKYVSGQAQQDTGSVRVGRISSSTVATSNHTWFWDRSNRILGIAEVPPFRHPLIVSRIVFKIIDMYLRVCEAVELMDGRIAMMWS